MNLKNFPIDKSWTLFLDRDGVINEKRENDYVKSWIEFKFIDGSVKAISKLSKIFGRILIVTNQQGIGKGLYTEIELEQIHEKMKNEISLSGGKIDKIYFAPFLESENNPCRKPGTGMAIAAKNDFPEINFQKSIIVGDSPSDMEFGKNLGMLKIYISNQKSNHQLQLADFNFRSLIDFADNI